MTDIQYHSMPGGGRIAFCHLPCGASGNVSGNTGPAIVFLPGYMSDMAGDKATALFNWCRANGRACLLLDYSGCGQSDGDFSQGTLSDWRDEVLALIAAQVEGRIVLVGSSMGGWLMLLVALALGEDRLAGLVGIAAAPDFSDWGYNAAEKAALRAGDTIYQASDYGYEPMPTHARFWQDADHHTLLNRPIAITCPVRLLHGQDDTDVPPAISLRLAAALTSEAIEITLVKGGDHRLSREGDIMLLQRIVGSIV